MQTGSGSASSRDQRGADGACGEAAGVCRVVFREYISFVCEQPGPAVGAVSLFRIGDSALYIDSGVSSVPGSSGQKGDPWRSTLALLYSFGGRYPGISLHHMLWD